MFSPLDSELTGPLFATEAMRGRFSDWARVAAMLRAEGALARACGADELAEALAGIRPEALDVEAIGRATALAGVPTIPFVTAVQALLPAGLERAFHRGATTQDVMDTALVLCCRDGLGLVAGEVGAILEGLGAMAVRYREAPCVGRTYGQHAAPVTFGFKAAVWLAGVAEAAERLPGVRGRFLRGSLGGPVGTLAAFGAEGSGVLERFCAELGLGVDPLAWHARRGRMAELGGWLAGLIGALAKMATDVAHLASTEVGEVAEPYVPGRGGSSAMPHKRNPVSCTVILAAHAAAPGLAATLLGAMAAAHERPAGLWHAEWHALPALFGLASGALREARALSEGLEVDAARMRDTIGLTRGLLFADAAAGVLAGSMGRGAAHAMVEAAADRVRRGEGTLAEVLGRLTEVDVAAAFDLAPAIAAAGPWVDRAVGEAVRVRTCLAEDGATATH